MNSNGLSVSARRSQAVQTPDFLAVTKGAVDGLLAQTQHMWVEGALVPLDDEHRRRVMEAHDDVAKVAVLAKSAPRRIE